MSNGAASGFVWKDNSPDGSCVDQLSKSLSCPRWVASLLVSRGISTSDAAAAWLDPRLKDLGDPFALPGVRSASARILDAIQASQRITVFGDYDVDGLTGVTLLTEFLRGAGAKVSVFLPHRLDEGYGLTIEALDRCIEESKPELLITVDCGTNSADAVNNARERGLDVIVTDHHAVGDSPAPALALVNPRFSADEQLHVLAGVGVAFKLCHGIVKLARQLQPESVTASYDVRGLLDLVALGTIADLVPLTGENRILVTHGLRALNATKRDGLIALKEVAQIKNRIDTYEVGYLIGPRLNASGRLGTALTSLKLLQSTNRAEASDLARELDSANRERQQVEKSIVSELLDRTETYFNSETTFGIVEASQDWHPGVVGIVASRVMQKYFRPAIVIGADDQGRAKGSCRSVPGFNMVEALAECRSLLVKHGGHAMAAGLEIEWDRVDEFRERFNRVAQDRLSGQNLVPELLLDGWLDAREIDEGTVSLLDRLRPFGMGYPEPLWACRGVALSGQPREVGKGHLKANFVCHGVVFEAIGFGLYHKPLPSGPIDAAFHLRKDTYLGREKLVLHLKDFRRTESAGN